MEPNVPEAIHGLRREVNLWTDHTIFQNVLVSVFDFVWPLRCMYSGKFSNLFIDSISPDSDNSTKFSAANWLLALHFVVKWYPHVHRVLQFFGQPSHIRVRCICSSTYSTTRVWSSFWKFSELNEVFDTVNYHIRICLGGCGTLGIASFMRTSLSTHICTAVRCYMLSTVDWIGKQNQFGEIIGVSLLKLNSLAHNKSVTFRRTTQQIKFIRRRNIFVFLTETCWCEWSSHFAAIKFIIIRSDRTFSFSRLAICMTQTRRDS